MWFSEVLWRKGAGELVSNISNFLITTWKSLSSPLIKSQMGLGLSDIQNYLQPHLTQSAWHQLQFFAYSSKERRW